MEVPVAQLICSCDSDVFSKGQVTAVTVDQGMEQVTLVAAQVETAEMEAMAAELGLAEKAVRRS